jgi:hypothetical protein
MTPLSMMTPGMKNLACAAMVDAVLTGLHFDNVSA